MSKQTGIQKTDDVLIQNVDWLLSLVDPEDKDVIRALNAVKKHYLKSMALAMATADEYLMQRDAALDEVELAGVALDSLTRQVDDLIFSMEDLRDRARDPERQVAEMMYTEMDFDNKADAQIAAEILTGRIDVYLSHYIKGDLREALEIAIEEVKETRLEMEEEGGVAE